MAKKRKSNYSVDTYDHPGQDWAHFKTLKKAVRFAIEHELPADRIVDFNGDPVEGLDLDDPQWWNHRRLETEYRNQKAALDISRGIVEHERDAYRNRQITMIQAGYVPIELITERLIEANVEATGQNHSTVTLVLSGNPGKVASEYNRRPFAVFLEHLKAGLGK